MRFVHLASCAGAFLILASGAALASWGSTAANDMHRPSTLCGIEHNLLGRESRPSNSSPVRLALHCRCCGTDENGHCNHQCCD